MLGGFVATPLYIAKAEFFRTLGHPARIRVLELLSAGERSVSELLPEVGLEASHLSQQLGVLRRGGLVTTRKQGSAVFYALASDDVAELLAVARKILTEVLAGQVEVLRELQEPPAAASASAHER
jgi:DNA-binding transcriptional ArsR family regulator